MSPFRAFRNVAAAAALAALLAPALALAANLSLQTTPTGAILDIDGETVGVTPYSGPLEPGRHLIAVRLPGYEAFSMDINMPADRNLTLPLPALKALASKKGRAAAAEAPAPAAPAAPSTAQVTFRTVPAGARVTIDGTFIGKSPAAARLPVGAHRVETSLTGYATQAWQYEAKAGKTDAIELKLAPANGVVSVTTTPAGAAVSIDGVDLGKSPVRAEAPAGEHVVVAKLAGYKNAEQRVTVASARETAATLALTGDAVLFTVTSTPPGAALFVAEQKVGVTPFTSGILPGHYLLRLELAGYKRVDAALDVSPGSAKVAKAFTLEPDRAALTVTTTPPGATVVVDGAEVGKSPVRVELAAGVHKVSAKLAGRKAAEHQVTLVAGKDASAALALAAEAIAFKVDSVPSGATLFVGGQKAGTTPFSSGIVPGEYVLALELPGYKRYETKVTALEGATLERLYKLERSVATLSVTTKPPGALVLVDGREAGPAPYEGEVAPGPHEVTAKATGFLDAHAKVDAVAGKSMPVTLALQPEPKPAEVAPPPPLPAPPKPPASTTEPVAFQIGSNPPGADLFIGAQKIGVTPFSAGIVPGHYVLTVQLDGFKRLEAKLDVNPGEPVSRTYTLEKDLAPLVIRPDASTMAAPPPPPGAPPPAAATTVNGAAKRAGAPPPPAPPAEAKKGGKVFTWIFLTLSAAAGGVGGYFGYTGYTLAQSDKVTNLTHSGQVTHFHSLTEVQAAKAVQYGNWANIGFGTAGGLMLLTIIAASAEGG